MKDKVTERQSQVGLKFHKPCAKNLEEQAKGTSLELACCGPSVQHMTTGSGGPILLAVSTWAAASSALLFSHRKLENCLSILRSICLPWYKIIANIYANRAIEHTFKVTVNCDCRFSHCLSHTWGQRGKAVNFLSKLWAALTPDVRI